MSETISELKPGVTLEEERTLFRFYCPDATSVECIIFDSYREKDEEGTSWPMEKGEEGEWYCEIPEDLEGKWYGYRSTFPDGHPSKNSPYYGAVFADPYSRHVTVRNRYQQDARSYIFREEFDWEGIGHCFPDDPRDLIIYETHLKDLTAHSSSRTRSLSSYKKFIEKEQKGGLPYLKKLGVNAVEFLPLQKFSPQEPPFGEKTPEGFHNTWNVYATNYWGYMTSFFFAPESSYASDISNNFSGKTTAAVHEFKQMVKELHRNGMTVIMDVVYNHTSLFDKNPLPHLLESIALRRDKHGNLLNRSGTGNEFKSEHPWSRQLIIDSLLHWIEEYKIDGFRFDLAALLDRDTWDAIKNSIHEKYPKAVLIAEPWGGYYSPKAFSDHGWASWNDRIRNTIKGSEPMHDRGYIFSEWQNETSLARLQNVFKGTLLSDDGGLFHTSEHSVNYLESHDGYTLGDFIRIGLNPEVQDESVKDNDTRTKLNQEEMKLSKFAALCLFVSQGVLMIHAGQEFARSKIIAPSLHPDPDRGKMDHNSYQKDNETNWINFESIRLNKSLYHYYRGLIEIRKNSPGLRRSESHAITFMHHDNPLIISFYIEGNDSGDLNDYYVVLNGTMDQLTRCQLPHGTWEVIVNHQLATCQGFNIVSDTVTIEPKSGMLLRKLRH